MESKLTYIVAVSGGIDSVCLLHMLVHGASQLHGAFADGTRFVVAHANHGIRGADSDRDEQFVKQLAESLGLDYVTENLALGAEASEEDARDARYAFLEKAKAKYRAAGILLAHHQGDVLETAVINILRGTGRKGVTSLRSKDEKIRPILSLTKTDIQTYAADNNLEWVEDSTNIDPKYLRNKIRLSLASKSDEQRLESMTKIAELTLTNDQLDREIGMILQYKLNGNAIVSRNWFVKLPHKVACELVHSILGKLEVGNITRDTVERVVVAIKVARPGTKVDIDGQTIGMATKRSFRIVDRQTLTARRL